jgi:MFS family permease
MLGGAVTSFWQFVSARIVLGVGEAPHFPTCARVSRDWFMSGCPLTRKRVSSGSDGGSGAVMSQAS